LSLAEVHVGAADTSCVIERPSNFKFNRLMSPRRAAFRGLCVLAVTGVAVTLMPVAASAAPGTPVLETPLLPQSIVGLSQGSTGSDVKAVQNALMASGISVFGGADGVYGTATMTAVSSFQSNRGLPRRRCRNG